MIRRPVTLWIGAAVIVAAEVLLALDVAARGVAVLPAGSGETVAAPQGALGVVARWVAVHMTPVCWCAYLLLFDGLLGSASPARTRPRRFWLCWVTSAGVWLFFDWVNFSFIHAWDYHGIEPLSLWHDWTARFIAFAAISPAMFLAAEVFARTRIGRLRGPPIAIGGALQVASVAAGAAALAFPFIVRDPVGSMTLWVSLVLLLDPINHRFGAPSLVGDWALGRYGRTVALLAGGMLCGFLWEFWNYWAPAKWTYHLPFLGALERVKLFEMPLPGFAGFPPFALECWVAFQTIALLAAGIRRGAVELLPDDAIL